MSLRQRLSRLERQSPRSTYAADLEQFDTATGALALALSPADRAEAEQAWAISRQLLRTYPGSAIGLVGITMQDFAL